MSSDERRPARRRPRPITPPWLPPGPLKDLKDLLHSLYLQAEAPTMEQIAAATARLADELAEEWRCPVDEIDELIGAAPKKDAVNRILRDDDVPPSEQDVVAVAVALARMATDRHDLRVLVDQVRGVWRRAQAAPPARRLGRPVSACDPLTLEVHRAMEVDGAPLDPLPLYVPRAHDARLRDVTDAAVAGASRIVTLVGGSSTGKTRAAWEAVQTLPKQWRLWHPIDPGRSQAIAQDLTEVGPFTVIWLNEAQHYLMPADAALAERIAAGLRTLLTDPARGPVLVIGTIWPEHWRLLTAAPAPPLEDVYAQARALLTGTEIPVPDRFETADLDALRRQATEDPRLAGAVEHAEQGQVTQYLAGAPALLERYRTAPAPARALIEAAMDARRLGHGPALPISLLEAAAVGYLTDSQWDLLGEDWLEQALAYTAAPCHGARGPLTRIRPRPGDPAPAESTYRLADYLEQHGRQIRDSVCAPTAFWEACRTHTRPVELFRIRTTLVVRCAADPSRIVDRDLAIALLEEALSGPQVPTDEVLTRAALGLMLFLRAVPVPLRQDDDVTAMMDFITAFVEGQFNTPARRDDRDRAMEHLQWLIEHDSPRSSTRWSAQQIVMGLQMVAEYEAGGPGQTGTVHLPRPMLRRAAAALVKARNAPRPARQRDT
ncbi:hypothetical protein ACFO1B_22660 [Dactylosporangium siamense]|uniref:Uncharacterized protein n=1 Tax=Dactylosporangium siamense TaxID=685454 RepID=A0A919UC79_9ACTN|nr:hypothetical protein [Dactylosporangium siamense]GIG50199.1 hypothetical protein Dsi01nite_082400 [Dactylosporangium siamense]